jgi:anti-sigma B factor antagonist
VLVMVSGELDMSSGSRVEEALAIALDEPSTTTVEVDVSGVTFIDMAGLQSLRLARQAAVERNRTFRLLTGESGAVRRLLQLTQLESDFR